MTEEQIKSFWQLHPCGDEQVGGLKKEDLDGYTTFFKNYDAFRYKKEAHIIKCLDRIDFSGKRVLEIGLGEGADSEQIIRRGAIWTGVDLTEESVSRVKIRLKLNQLQYDNILKGSVLELPFKDKSFDIVFSHGVLHHVPNIIQAQKEITRVLKPDGELIAMLYSKWSLNYLFSIGLLRRLGLLLLYILKYSPSPMYAQHILNVKKFGLFRYMRMETFIHYNTDGPFNPYSKVYDMAMVRSDFPDFKIVKGYKRFMHAPPLPISWMPFEKLAGWHLWVHMRPKNNL